MIMASFAEVLSIGSVIPFLAILTNPDSIKDIPFALEILNLFEYESSADLVLPITILFILAAILAGSMRIFVLWFNTKLSFSIGRDLGVQAFKATLNQPYEVHISTNSSEVISSIVTKMYATTLCLSQSLSLITSLVLSLSIVFILLVIDIQIALFSAIVIGGSYIVMSYFFRIKLSRNSKSVDLGTTKSLKILQEGLGGIRDVLLSRNQRVYERNFYLSQLDLRAAQGNNHFLGGSPRFLMESIGMSLIAILAYASISSGASAINFLPSLGAIALGAQKLLPAGHQIYASWAGIAGNRDSFRSVLDILDQPYDEKVKEPVEPLEFEQSIVFDSVSFQYEDDKKVLEDFNLTIKKGERLGVVGKTGSGKSTFTDLLMGLLKPSKGNLLIDGRPVNKKNVDRLMSIVAHVPQFIYLADLSIAENIALGEEKNDINEEEIIKAAKQASILDFIDNCPNGFNTMVGEQGIKLSGGQRQRIGLARALYRKSKILVLDEATSSLDNQTEKAIMSSIENLDDNLTVVIIAHRLTTIKSCDSIAILEDGAVLARDSYHNLLKNNSYFQELSQETARE
jgi:ATP-binding cassette subfamily B protein